MLPEGVCKGQLREILAEEEKVKERWRSYFDKLSNEEFDWKRDDLDNDNMVYGPINKITF